MNVTKRILSALAGWALTKTGDGGPADEAFRKLRDGCDAAIEYAPAEGNEDVATTQPTTTHVVKVIPARVSQALGVRTCRDGGEHRFHIATQHCLHCGLSYRAVKDREPEFIGK